MTTETHPHPITKYLEETRTSLAMLAAWVAVSEGMIRKYQKGTPIPRDRAVALSAATGGRLAVTELLFPNGIPPTARLTPDDAVVPTNGDAPVTESDFETNK